MEITGSPFSDHIYKRGNGFMTKVARLAIYLDQVTQRVTSDSASDIELSEEEGVSESQ